MDEKKFEEYLNRYVDNELKGKDLEQFETYISGNPIAQLELEKSQKFENLLKSYMVQEEAPYELRESVINALNQQTWLEKLLQLNWLKGVGVATVSFLIVAFITVGVLNNPYPVFAAAVENHIRFTEGSEPLELKTNSIEEAITWFNKRLDFQISRPHVDLMKADLIGARIIEVKGRRGAFFTFEKEGKRFSAVFLDFKNKKMPKKDVKTVKESAASRLLAKNESGFNCVLCFHKSDDTGCMIISDMPEAELMKLLG